MNCTEADKLTHAYIDAELAGVDRSAYEQHVLDCKNCFRASRLQARFKAAVRGYLSRRPVPAQFEDRIRASLNQGSPGARRWPWQEYPRLVPAMAVAAVLLLVVTVGRARNSPLLEQALRTYHAAMPMDVLDSDCASIGSWFRGRVDFALQPPSLGAQANCQGGRLVTVRDRMGAYLTYQTRTGHRIGVMVVDTDDEPRAGQHRVLAGHDVYFSNGRGASTAAFQGRDGLTYVLTTSDPDQDTLSNYVNAVFEQRH